MEGRREGVLWYRRITRSWSDRAQGEARRAGARAMLRSRVIVPGRSAPTSFGMVDSGGSGVRTGVTSASGTGGISLGR